MPWPDMEESFGILVTSSLLLTNSASTPNFNIISLRLTNPPPTFVPCDWSHLGKWVGLFCLATLRR